MNWFIGNTHYMESESNYRICKTGEGAPYLAWTPAQIIGERKARYALGETIPQRRALIGVSDTAKGAMALCEQHEVAA